MPRKLIFLLPAFLLLACCHLLGNPGSPGSFLTAYLKANQFFNSNSPTDITDSLALAGFEQVILQLEKARDERYDSLLFQSYLKKGILLDVKNKNAAAKEAYLKAAAMPLRNNRLGDSLLFRPYIYAGTNYFNLNNFDSANYFLIRAEALVKRFPALPETERLYNTLGALHFINGNYLQSKIYFSQALDFIKNKKTYDRVFGLGLQSNIASSFYKQGLYNEALDIYRQVIKEKIPAGYVYNGIYMNMGKAFAAIKKYNEALACFRKINPSETPAVLNELALAQYELQRPDSAIYYLDRLTALQQAGKINMPDIGINNLYRATLLADQRQYMSALQTLQQAVISFSGNFNNPDIYSNPVNFAGSYTYYRLFDALYKKAQIFELQDSITPGGQYLSASLAAYQAALTLLNFIEKSYDTDDAKLFLKKKSQNIYSEALSVCLRLYQLHPDGKYLEAAFMITEKNRASVMAANLRQKNSTQLPGVDNTFSETERNIKFAIARLDIKSEQSADNAVLEKLAKEKANKEIELSRLQKNLEQNSHYFQLKYADDFHGAGGVKEKLDNHQALFSFYFTKNRLHVFAFTKSSFQYIAIDSVDALEQEITDWVNMLRTSGDGKKFKAGLTGQRLYKQLIKPMQLLAPGKDEWIVIPDGKLYLLPFESLPDANTGKYLLETTTISYQFSSRFMLNNSEEVKKNNQPVAVLSFAPFAAAGAGYHQAGFDFINRLPASADEIASLSGRSFSNAQASKSMFLQEAGSYPIIHLATHAIADQQNPAASFIAFYPEKKSPEENCLYMEEIYGLNMDACKLVIISACETGKGELVNNEGVISLGRAFAYAGCGATINSLWKADDNATAAILKKFHAYLQQGYTKSKALQKAKLDYINSDALYKSPAYWSNLVLTGNTEPVYKDKTYHTLIIATAAVCLFMMMGIITLKKRKKSRRLSQQQ